MTFPFRNKFNAKKTEVDGITFDSKAEAKRYGELKQLRDAGKITGLVLQPCYPMAVLCPNGELEIFAMYKADFAYWDVEREKRIVEDVKGMPTPVYRHKKKHVERQYGIRITEIGGRKKRKAKKTA